MEKFHVAYLVLLVLLLKFSNSNTVQLSEQKLLTQLQKTFHEEKAIKLIKNAIYNNVRLESTEVLEYLKQNKWVTAVNYAIDFLVDLKTDQTKHYLKSFKENIESQLENLKSSCKKKKKNLIKISPVFQWYQDDIKIKIRVRFAKNLETPGDKDLKNFQVYLGTNILIISGYKEHPDFTVWYFREIEVFGQSRRETLTYYQETDGTYIISFKKRVFTLIWKFLDCASCDRYNIFTWFDLNRKFHKSKHFSNYKNHIEDNVFLADMDDYQKLQINDKSNRFKKIEENFLYLSTKQSQNRNFCNSPIDETYCILPEITDWNFWLY